MYFLLDGGYLDDDTDFNLELDTVVSEVADDEVDVHMKHTTPNMDSELSTALKESSD